MHVAAALTRIFRSVRDYDCMQVYRTCSFLTYLANFHPAHALGMVYESRNGLGWDITCMGNFWWNQKLHNYARCEKFNINLRSPWHAVQWHQAVLHALLEPILQLVIYPIRLACCQPVFHENYCERPSLHLTQSGLFSNTIKARTEIYRLRFSDFIFLCSAWAALRSR